MKKLKTIKINFSDFWYPSTIEEIKLRWIYRFLSKYYTIEITENPDFLFYSCFGYEYLKYDCIRIFYTGENVRPNFNECDYAFSFDFPETKRNYRLPLYRACREYELLFEKRNIDSIISENRKFCCFLNSNGKSKERIKFFDKLTSYKKVDSGGKIRNNLGFRVDNKMNFLRKYKFSIAFENSEFPGYTTEKLLDAFVANTIPIYWGNPEVGKDFNTNAFINCHEYDSFEDVINHIKEIDNNENLYRKYLNEPFFLGGVENEFAKEENILKKFEQIFNSSQKYVSPYSRTVGKIKYPIKRIELACKHLIINFANKLS